jgi:hypothetical protein
MLITMRGAAHLRFNATMLQRRRHHQALLKCRMLGGGSGPHRSGRTAPATHLCQIYRNWQLDLAGAMKLVLTLARAVLSGRANAQIDSQAAAHREDICRLWVQELRLALEVLQ